MPVAETDRSGALAARLSVVMLLGAVALGILGMHGLVSGAGAPAHQGHHAGQLVAAVAVPDAVGDAAVEATGAAGDDSSPVGAHGALALCLMVLTPAFAVGLWLLVTGRTGGWRIPRLLARLRPASDDVVLPPPFRRRLTVLRI